MDGISIEMPEPGVARVSIDNAPLNVLTQAVRRQLGDTLLALSEKPDVRCVVFGSGERAFCAGADLTEFPLRFDPEVAAQHADNAHRMMLALVELGIPVIAAVHGHCLGGGLELALGCTLRIAGRSAQFGLPEIDRGVWPGTGGIVLLERLVGPATAKRLLYGGDRVSAEQALALGLVDEMVDDARLEARALELAATWAGKPGGSIRTITELIDRDFRASFREYLQVEHRHFVQAYQSHDAREGNRAFFEKRAPHWLHR
jgi:enoyl-CoA hydratase/carnithine racemase